MSYVKQFTYNYVKLWNGVWGNSACKGQETVLSGWQAGQLNYQYTFNLLTDVGEALILVQFQLNKRL